MQVRLLESISQRSSVYFLYKEWGNEGTFAFLFIQNSLVNDFKAFHQKCVVESRPQEATQIECSLVCSYSASVNNDFYSCSPSQV